METFQYSVPALFALGIVLLIQLLKSERIPITIPAAWQPLTATVTGLALLVATRVAQGYPIGRAVFDGLLAGLGAVGMFEVVKQAKGPSDPPPPPPPPPTGGSALPPTDPFRAGGAMRVVFGAVFALVAFGCSDVTTVNRAVSVANAASEVQTAAAPFLDEECTRPALALRAQEPSPERSKATAKLLEKCDGAMLSYDVVRQQVLRLRALILKAEGPEGVTVGDILDAIKQLTKDAADLVGRIDQMRRAAR